jgi:hypothetical protein
VCGKFRVILYDNLCPSAEHGIWMAKTRATPRILAKNKTVPVTKQKATKVYGEIKLLLHDTCWCCSLCIHWLEGSEGIISSLESNFESLILQLIIY